ncbi:MAG: tetratricopeptide repeat protein [Caldilineaceae bacterium]|nr:tetratricopeptide repeat protein [Caldilineaceae bacterium]
MPVQTTPFMGRQTEIEEITRRLQDPTCRLLTLVGPGGVGKTRLAVECAVRLTDLFTHGVFFVDLHTVHSPDLLEIAIADSLQLHFNVAQSLSQQWANLLRQKKMLLVLDNMEHLLAGATALSDLLFATPDLKLLVTSREALNMEAEWLYPLAGMAYPNNHQVDDLEAYGAVAFFTQRARRLRPDFSLAEEAEGVVRICEQVEGLPLALDLAVAWVKVLRCVEIADEIQQNIDFLTTRLRQTPAPHRSMRAVFEHSWQLMSRAEQELFGRLAIFHGSFTRQAAMQVAGASLEMLSALVDKSLLRWHPNRRYHLHALIHQFALDRLAANPAAATAIHQRHCDYFADFVLSAADGLIGGAQFETLDQIQADLDNIRVAWRYAVQTQNGASLQKMGHILSNYFQFRGRYQEPVRMLEDGIAVLTQTADSDDNDRFISLFHLELVWFNVRLGRISKAAYHAGQAQSWLNRRNHLPLPGIGTHPQIAFGMLASIRGDYHEALRCYLTVYKESVVHQHLCNQQYACYGLANAALELDDLETAARYAQEGVALCKAEGEFWVRAYLLIQLGSVALRQDDPTSARAYFEESYALRTRFNDPEGMGLALNHLGEVYLRQQNLAAAVQSFNHSFQLYQEIGDRGGLAMALAGLGITAVRQNQFDVGRERLAQALSIAAEIGYGALLRRLHPWVEDLLRQIQISPAAPLAQLAEGKAEAVKAIAAQLQTLSIVHPTDKKEDLSAANPNAALIEPLTEREMIVLQHLAQGLSNQEIANTLILSLGTVKWYTGQIYGKLGVGNRAQALIRARQLNLA